MLDTLITSKTRIKLLVKFFLNPQMKGYLRGLEQEFEEGSNAIRIELNRFEEAGLLKTTTTGNKKYFQANQKHPMFSELNALMKKHLGIDKVIEWVVNKSGDLEAVYLTGKLAHGIDSKIIDIIIVGENINDGFIQELALKAEGIIQKKIRWIPFTKAQFEADRDEFGSLLMIWEKEN